MAAGPYFIGVDVGTKSVRSGLFTTAGRLVSRSTHEIRIWTNSGFSEGSREQATTDIWNAVCSTVKEVCSHVDPALIKGIGFDATCSLVAVDTKGLPVTVSPSKDPERNVILWQDHRAISEAELINGTKHPVLTFVGGKISPEMQPPKLLWLKKNLFEECWKKAGYFFDLADYLTYRVTGATSRSLCCVVCKWTYVGHHPNEEGLTHGWNESFWRTIGLGDMVDERFARIGTEVLCPGEPVGNGLNEQGAKELGLCVGTPVGTAIIDAHAGGLGVLGADVSLAVGGNVDLTARLALIGGTSSCHMATSNKPLFVPGVWGPYYSVMVPRMFLSEGGQSCAGELLDHILTCHSELFHSLQERAKQRQCTEYEEAEAILNDLSRERSLPNVAFLTSDVHVLPDFCGNRSPLADPHIQGMLCGLTLTSTLEELAVLYLAAVQALAYGTQHIVETLERSGHHLQVILICGGLRHNALYIQQHADITGLPVLLMDEKESVLAGSAILAAAASGDNVFEAMCRMTMVTPEATVDPSTDPKLKEYHSKKYRVFQELYKDQKKYKSMMK